MLFQAMDYIYEVYKEKSFTAAAKTLYISQPALSAAIRKAEGEIGVRIFDRSTNPIRLTDAGKAYIEAVEKIKEIERNLITQLNDISNLKTGRLTVSGASFISSYIIPQILKNFRRRYPGICTELVENNSFSLQEQLLLEETDLMIDYSFDSDLYASFPVFQENILLAVPENSHVNSRFPGISLTKDDIRAGRHLREDCPKIPLQEFQKEPFIILKKGNDMRERAFALIEENNFEAKVVINLDQLITSFNFVKAGIGVAFVTDTVIKAADSTGVVFYKLDSSDTLRSVRVAYKKNRYISQAVVDAFIRTTREVYEKDLFVPQEYEKGQKESGGR